MKLDRPFTALVTGANGGLGAAIARALHAKGGKIILSGRRPEALAPLATELGADVVLADQANPLDAQRLCEEACHADVAVLNAALPASGNLFDLSPALIEDMVRVNLTSPILTARALGKSMASRGGGHIVMISSIAGIVPSPGGTLYSATKFGLRGFALSLRAELSTSNVGVSTIYPGFIRDAGMFANSGVTLPTGMGTKSPEDVGRAVVRAITRNQAEVKIAALDQKAAAFFAAVAPGLTGVAAGMPMAKKLAADIAAGQAKKALERSE